MFILFFFFFLKILGEKFFHVRLFICFEIPPYKGKSSPVGSEITFALVCSKKHSRTMHMLSVHYRSERTSLAHDMLPVGEFIYPEPNVWP